MLTGMAKLQCLVYVTKNVKISFIYLFIYCLLLTSLAMNLEWCCCQQVAHFCYLNFCFLLRDICKTKENKEVTQSLNYRMILLISLTSNLTDQCSDFILSDLSLILILNLTYVDQVMINLEYQEKARKTVRTNIVPSSMTKRRYQLSNKAFSYLSSS